MTATITYSPGSGSSDTPIGPYDLIANATGAEAVPGGVSLSDYLDAAVGDDQGALLSRTASGWEILSPGPAGTVLTSGGASSDLSWGSASANPTVEVTGTSATLSVNTAYIANNGSRVTLTLPASAPLGAVFIIIGKGAGGWQVVPGVGQTIFAASTSTTVSLASTNLGDCVMLTTITANTGFRANTIVGNLTVN